MAGAWRRGALSLLLVGLGATAATLAAAGPGPSGAVPDPVPVAGPDDRPNIVLVMTDDQNDYELEWMPLTRAALADGGMEFTDAVSPHPLCCPARAELVTGQYAHNNGVRHNNGPYGGFEALDRVETLGSWFSGAGYNTGLVGKYLNRYAYDDGPEPGWTRWDALTRGVYDYEDFSFHADGDEEHFRGSYVTTQVERRTNDTVRRFAASSRPFLLFSWHVAPHYRYDEERRPAPPRAAPGDERLFQQATPPSFDKPSHAERRVEDQQRVFRNRDVPPEGPIRAEFRARLRSLQAVDRAVASLVETLQETGEWEDTYLFFTSDNGYLLGEHRYVGKNVLAEEALQVPLLVRGPGVAAGSTSSAPASLVDLPATFAELAGVTPGRRLDGDSLVPALTGAPSERRDTTLVQTGRSEGDGWALRGVRTDRYLYAARSDDTDVVLYDRLVDPYETRNVAQDPAYAVVRAELEARRRQLLSCQGWSCNKRFGPVVEPLR